MKDHVPARPPMLTCQQVTERLSDHLDRGLTLRQRLAVEVHLAICPNCRAYHRELRTTLGLSRAAASPPPTPEVEAGLMALFDQLALPRPR